MQFATDEEIKSAHDILLKGKKPFNDSRVNIIKENNSCYVQACPGSGKTTALLAKLIILANKMPLSEGKGVCVLTHTNVAIDEIKARLGQKADVLFRYPNFFGTIQSFLHKYITTAALHHLYGSQLSYVDDDMANAILLKKYGKLTYQNALRKLVYRHAAYKNSLEEDIILSFKVDWPNNKVVTDSGPIGMNTSGGGEFIKLKEEMYSEGVLKFDEAYDLSFRYIREKGLDFSSFSDKRFKYLFIDEVQDCDGRQIELIQKVFDEEKVIIQRFGDYCQAIFGGVEASGRNNAELKNDNILSIHESNRFGENIAKPLRSLCMEDNSPLMGSEDVPSLRPIIITYEDPLTVLPKYVELLNSKTIPEMGNRSVLEIANDERAEDPLHRINLKACGWVGKKGSSSQKRYIESYFPRFEKKDVKQRPERESFDDFILRNSERTVKDYASSIIQGILKFLDLCNVKNGSRPYTRTSFLQTLALRGSKLKENFLQEIMKWSLLVIKSNDDSDIRNIKGEIYRYITTKLLPEFGAKTIETANAFFNAKSNGVSSPQEVKEGNIYHGNGIDIEVATVHAIKGETLASTLYLETFYNKKYESDRLSEQFKGVVYNGANEDVLKSLKVVYVGMSRPRYLLCVAIQKDRFDNMDCPELRNIWDVVEA